MKTYGYYRGGLNDSGQYIHERSEDGIQWEFYDPEQVINFIDTGNDPAITDNSLSVTHHCPNCEAAARELAELQALCDREAALLTAVAVAERAKSAMREIADLKSDKAWADKLSAENADELSNLRREHEGMTGVPVICGCGDHIGYAEVIGLSQDGAVCGNCAVGRKDYDARMELVELRERVNMAGELADSYKHFYEVEIELAQQYYRDRESLHSGIERILADYPRAIKQDAEEALRVLLAETEAAK